MLLFLDFYLCLELPFIYGKCYLTGFSFIEIRSTSPVNKFEKVSQFKTNIQKIVIHMDSDKAKFVQW